MEAIASSRAQMEALVEEMKGIQRDIGKAVNDVSGLSAQLTENELVKKELAMLDDDGKVYKLVGPVLIKQDLNEARSNVDKRISFISAEMKRGEERTKSLEKKQASVKIKILEEQQKIQRLVQQAAGKK